MPSTNLALKVRIIRKNEGRQSLRQLDFVVSAAITFVKIAVSITPIYVKTNLRKEKWNCIYFFIYYSSLYLFVFKPVHKQRMYTSPKLNESRSSCQNIFKNWVTVGKSLSKDFFEHPLLLYLISIRGESRPSFVDYLDYVKSGISAPWARPCRQNIDLPKQSIHLAYGENKCWTLLNKGFLLLLCLSVYFSICLPACLSARLSVCLLPVSLSLYLLAYLSACIMPACLPVYLLAYLSSCKPACLSTCLSTCLSALPACLPFYLPDCLLIYLPAFPYVFLSVCPSVYLPSRNNLPLLQLSKPVLQMKFASIPLESSLFS